MMVGRQGIWNKGKKGLQHHSEEIRRKIGLASKNIAMIQISNGTRKGLFQKGHDLNLEEKNPNWKNGKYVKHIKIREKIRKRDGYRCQECFMEESKLKRKLDVHHIDFDKKNNNPSNLITLCLFCHGKTNWNRNDWIEHFNKFMNERGIQ